MQHINLRSFLRLAAIVTLLLGAGLMLEPSPILSFFADGTIPNNVHFVRFLGTALIGFGVINWRNSTITHQPHIVLNGLYGNLASLGLATIVDVVSLAQGVLNMRGWAILALHVFFTLGFSYYSIQVRGQLKENLL